MQQVLQKLAEIDQTLIEHSKKLAEHDQQFVKIDKRFDAVDKRFEAVDKRFDQIDGQIDFLAKKMLEHDGRLDHIDEKLEQTATKDDISRVMNSLDKIVKLYENKDQELPFLARGLRNVEDKVEVHDKDIKAMKPLLGIA
ncbi:MAG: hypothetical protein A2538_05175 [Candidatus Magasanikbacteria bacterium RIFOXYD2_FULL_41_14]|uniref:t-SNARE coiled-coil homology domain-containing protein n=1 Tax=Candidatus Magasanikbacteria bacterium RIFOXYD2_FULL_41_14 TaxID=1798709 RepID=A0A1F6PGI8_9BACT|nr:MAG: hypothetical protein A2538_05175 [Candidatus Magasanikbacteria bacterium RIFOXYD2_FULL_41_14]